MGRSQATPENAFLHAGPRGISFHHDPPFPKRNGVARETGTTSWVVVKNSQGDTFAAR
jgi:hypothetical protein